jgi:hypothetical protein
MSNARAIKLGAGGLVAVAAALWFSPPQQLTDWLSPQIPVTTKEPTGSETGTEAPAEVALAINPLSTLTAEQFKETLERPLFNPGRAGRPKDVEPEPEPEPEVAEEEPPADDGINAADFSLLAVAGDQSDLVAMVKWTKTNQVYRLKRGQFLSSLELVKVDMREAVLQKDDKTITLALFARAAGESEVVPVSDEEDAEEEEDTGEEEEDASEDEEDTAEDEEDTGDEEEDASEDESDEEFVNEADEEE